MQYTGPSRKTRIWLLEFSVDLDLARVNAQCGTRSLKALMANPQTEREMQVALARVEDSTRLKAEYVREFLYQILEFCPGDYFQPDGSGHWTIDEAKYQAIPQSVRRFITDFQLRPGGLIAVKFVSKEKALELAARFTLIQKTEMKLENQVPWYELATKAVVPVEDELNKRIAAVGRPLNGNGAAH